MAGVGRWSSLVTIVLLAACTAHAGVLQKGDAKGKDATSCGREHGCRHPHDHRCDPPFAPILGSAPAVMAPVVLQRQEVRKLPKDDERQEDHLEQLEELLRLLDDLTPDLAESEASAAPRTPAIDQVLQQMVARLSALEDSQLETRQLLNSRLGGTVQTLEKTTEALEQMQTQISEMQRRLDKLDADNSP